MNKTDYEIYADWIKSQVQDERDPEWVLSRLIVLLRQSESESDDRKSKSANAGIAPMVPPVPPVPGYPHAGKQNECGIYADWIEHLREKGANSEWILPRIFRLLRLSDFEHGSGLMTGSLSWAIFGQAAGPTIP